MVTTQVCSSLSCMSAGALVAVAAVAGLCDGWRMDWGRKEGEEVVRERGFGFSVRHTQKTTPFRCIYGLTMVSVDQRKNQLS